MTNFCTVQDVRKALDSHPDFTGNDHLIATCIEQTSALIRAYTRRDWDMAEYTDFKDTSDIDVAIGRGRGTYTIHLREKPVSIEVGKAPKLRYSPSGRWDDTTDLAANIYQVDVRKNQIIMYPALMVSRPRALRVVYWAGYVTQDIADPNATNADPDCLAVPGHIKAAAIAQATFLVKRSLNDVSGTNRKDSGDRLAHYGMNNTSGLIRDALALLRTEVRLLTSG